jgi:hypothetical protein
VLIQNLETVTTTNEGPQIDENHNQLATATPQPNTKKLTRKRQKNPERWKANTRKRLRQSGQAYTSVTGQEVPARTLKKTKDCTSCKFKCSQYVTREDQERRFEDFWKLSDSENFLYYSKTTCRFAKQRKRTEADISKKNFSYTYHVFLNDIPIRVCKQFYCGTHGISPHRISYYHEKKKDPMTGINPEADLRGKGSVAKIPEAKKEKVRQHIQSFPRVASHYCRAKTNKEYLDPLLSVARMHDLYSEQCAAAGDEPVTLNGYRTIFNTEFNIGFHIPKSDRCDLCEERKRNDEEDFSIIHSKHIESKIATKQERDKDRAGTDVVVCLDMQNVIALPRANISSFFYKRKLNLYNLTAHASGGIPKQKKGYCCIWTEAQHGRAGNDLASAAIAILEKVIEHYPDTSKLILWTDSCVPQNRNSVLSLAIMKFIQRHPRIVEIEQKYGEPGHSAIQEVDNLHSLIEKSMKLVEIYSPLGFIRMLLNMRPSLEVIQLRKVYNYLTATKSLSFVSLPYTKVKHLKYKQEDSFIVR